MLALPVEPGNAGRYPGGMASRVAVLEHIARTTTASLERVTRGMATQRAETRALQDRLERRIDTLASDQQRRIDMFAAEQCPDLRWVPGVMLAGFTSLLGAFGAMLGVMAHGFPRL